MNESNAENFARGITARRSRTQLKVRSRMKMGSIQYCRSLLLWNGQMMNDNQVIHLPKVSLHFYRYILRMNCHKKMLRTSHFFSGSSSSHQHFEADGSSMESLPQNEQSIFGQRSKTIRCMYYPKCNRSNEECHFIHPDHKCKLVDFRKKICK